MSRGPGRWQRAILARLETLEQCYLYEVLPVRPVKEWSRSFERYVERSRTTRSDRVAVIRAAHGLARQGLIQLDTGRWWTNHSLWTGERWQRLGAVIVARPGVVIDRWRLGFAYEAAGRKEAHRQRVACPKPPLTEEFWVTEVTTLKPAQLGAVASAVKLMAREGPVSEAQVTAFLEKIPGFTGELVHAALAQLQASGDYQRLIEEARS
jgi:hypothetical protein